MIPSSIKTTSNLCTLLKHLDAKFGSVSVDGIASELLNKTLPYTLPVTHIFNFCFSAGVYPDLWSTAIICPILMILQVHFLTVYNFQDSGTHCR